MDKDLRASLVAAGSAAALSALIGMFARVGFFTLLFRAMICALLIGAVVYCGILLLRSLVPSLFSINETDQEFDALRGDDSGRGANVDIVLPGEAAAPESYIGADEISGYGPIGRSGTAFPGAGREGSGENTPDAEAAELAPVDEASLLDTDGSDGEAVAAMPVGSSPETGRRPSAGFDDLDVLPDLEGFSDSFTASEFRSGGSSAANGQQKSYGEHGPSGSKPGQESLDPASLAQAVRTILKRDQKG